MLDALLVMVWANSQYNVAPSDVTQTSGLLTAPHAYERAVLLANLLTGRPLGHVQLRLEEGPTFGLTWEVSSNEALLSLSAADGQLRSFFDQTQPEVPHPDRGPYVPQLDTTQEAVDAAKALFSRLGLAEKTMRWTVQREAEVPGRWGYVLVRGNVSERQRPVVQAYALASFDQKTAKPTYVQSYLSYRIDTWEPDLSQVAARAKAKQFYDAAFPEGKRWPIANSPGELVYAPKLGNMGMPRVRRTGTVLPVRIAYRFTFGDDVLFVDAVNGENLGGFAGKRPPRP